MASLLQLLVSSSLLNATLVVPAGTRNQDSDSTSVAPHDVESTYEDLRLDVEAAKCPDTPEDEVVLQLRTYFPNGFDDEDEVDLEFTKGELATVPYVKEAAAWVFPDGRKFVVNAIHALAP